jgi:hypothetical protein
MACAKAASVDALATVYRGPSVNSRAETCALCQGTANAAA